MTDLLVSVDVAAALVSVELAEQLVSLDAAQLIAAVDIQPSVVSFEVSNIVRVDVDDWPDRVPVTYEGELVTFEGETIYTRGAGMADLEQLGEVLQRLTDPFQRRVATRANKQMPCRVTDSDGDLACDIAVQVKPAAGAFISAVVSGWAITSIGNGTRVGCVMYFSNDGGATARAWGAVAIGDTVHWNGSVAGAQLDASDRLDLIFEEGT